MTLAGAIAGAGMTTGEAGRLAPMRVKTPLVPHTFMPGAARQPGGRQRGAGQPANPFAVFDVKPEYDPTKISQIAQSGYNADEAQAQKYASMGFLTDDQLRGQAATRAGQETALGASLAAALANVQQATVATGNAAGASLGAGAATNAQQVAGLTGGATDPNVAPARAVLASQTAGDANAYGSAVQAALSAAKNQADQAYATGESQVQTNSADKAKALASLLSSIPPVSTRTTTMTDANAKIDAANKAQEYGVWNNLENRRLTAQAAGDKKGEAAASLEERSYEASLASGDRRYAADTAATTSRGNAALTAQTSRRNADVQAATRLTTAKMNAANRLLVQEAKTGANGQKPITASQASAIAKQAFKLATDPGGVETAGPRTTTGYTVILGPTLEASGLPDPAVNGGKGTTLHNVSAAALEKLQAAAKQPNAPKVVSSNPETKTGAKTLKDQPSDWTRYKRALGYVMQTTGRSRAGAVQYLSTLDIKAPASAGAADGGGG